MPHRPFPHPPRAFARLPRPAALAVALGAVALAGCGDDLLEAASIYNVDTAVKDYVVYPFSTAAAPLPTALSIGALQSVRPAVTTATLSSGLALLVPNFDFVVDVQADGGVRLVPSKLIAGLENTGRVLRTGVMVVNTPYDSLKAAPSGDYQRDSVTVVRVGQTVAVETEPAACLTNSRSFIYAKLVVDSVSAVTGAVYFRARIDPNCGYRSLQPGRPTS